MKLKTNCSHPHLRNGRALSQRHRPTSSSSYSNPALYSNDDAFAEASYWNKRYQGDPATFEWYRGYRSLAPLLIKYLDPALPLLQVGVGTSTLQLDMVEQAGFVAILNMDYSSVCINQMREAHGHLPQLTYLIGDARNMPEVKTASFPGLLDKGTLDALLCGDAAAEDADRMLREVSRVLQPGGVYLMITSQAPQGRYRYICSPEFCWCEISVYEVGQQGLLEGPYDLMGAAAAEATAGAAGAAGTGEHVVSGGGEDGGDSIAEDSRLTEERLRGLGLPKQKYSHFVYVCRKQT